MSEDDKVKDHPAKDNKTPSETIAAQLLDAERKKLNDELKRAVEEVSKAHDVLVNAVQKAVEIEEKMRDLPGRKIDLKAIAASLGI